MKKIVRLQIMLETSFDTGDMTPSEVAKKMVHIKKWVRNLLLNEASYIPLDDNEDETSSSSKIDITIVNR